MPCTRLAGLAVSAALAAPTPAHAAWRDPSPHRVRFVAVEPGVRVEVLDWGGTGRPLVLLAGGGNTAHVFDEFAPKLAKDHHVYGITRRGFGASGFSPPERTMDRLRDDVVAVLDALDLRRPLLVGHSIAGAEMSAVATAYPARVGGLVYLEAGYPYAFDNGQGPAMDEFLRLSGPRPPAGTGGTARNFRGLWRREAETTGFRIPEAELRQTWDTTADGRPVNRREFPGGPMFGAILAGPNRFGAITVPPLAIFAIPHVPERWIEHSSDPTVRQAAKVYFGAIDALADRQARTFERGVPTARVVRLRGSHHVFLSNERDVLREMRTFARELDQRLRPAESATSNSRHDVLPVAYSLPAASTIRPSAVATRPPTWTAVPRARTRPVSTVRGRR